MRGRVVPLAVVAVLVAVAYVSSEWLQRERRMAASRPVVVPPLSQAAQAGSRAFERHCAVCHGRDAGGSPAGPTLIDPIYRSAHHGDTSFVLAVRHGVAAHHWTFGNMPAVPGLNAGEVATIVRYVREVQKANGVE